MDVKAYSIATKLIQHISPIITEEQNQNLMTFPQKKRFFKKYLPEKLIQAWMASP